MEQVGFQLYMLRYLEERNRTSLTVGCERLFLSCQYHSLLGRKNAQQNLSEPLHLTNCFRVVQKNTMPQCTMHRQQLICIHNYYACTRRTVLLSSIHTQYEYIILQYTQNLLGIPTVLQRKEFFQLSSDVVNRLRLRSVDVDQHKNVEHGGGLHFVSPTAVPSNRTQILQYIQM